MSQFLLICIVIGVSFGLSISIQLQCACWEMKTQSDCIDLECQWDQDQCRDLDCSMASNKEECDDEDDDEDEDEDESVVSCLAIKTSSKCYGYQDNIKECMWSSITNTCVAFTMNQCSDADPYGESFCDEDSCYWSSNRCQQLSCNSFNTNDKCSGYFSIGVSSWNACSWNGSICIDLTSVSEYTAASCLKYSYYTYAWDPVTKECNMCVFAYPLKWTLVLMTVWII